MDPELGRHEKKGELVEKSNAIMLARKYDWMNENDPMIDMYSRVTARFKRPREENKGVNLSPDPNSNSNLCSQYASRIEASEEEGDSKPPMVLEPSRKQLRRISKPTLPELKNATTRPELIEWFDVDAPEPYFLVRLKTLPNVVQVPSNWQQRSEMPQFSLKPQYELPQNITDAYTQDARKGDKLDVDYDKMHDAFFSDDTKKPELTLLPYGRVVDLKLRKAYKPTSSPSSSHLSSRAVGPPPPSQKLLKALGISNQDPLPWEAAARRLGPSPGYAHFRTGDSSETILWGNMV